jgi:hypothetical protein
MSLERQDIRSKLDPDMKRALQAICDARGITESDFIEELLVPEIKRLVHEASVITERLHGRGATGKNREKSGAAGSNGGDRP